MTAPLVDSDAEEQVIGACLVNRAAIEHVVGVLLPFDFASPHRSQAFAALVELHQRGDPLDVTLVVAELRRCNADWPESGQDLLNWLSNVGNPSAAGHYASLVRIASTRRQLREIAHDLDDAAKDPAKDPGDVADEISGRLTHMDVAFTGRIVGDCDIDEWLATPEEAEAPPVIDGLLSEDDRTVLVAPEGVGKSELLRQVAVCASAGIHPFTFSAIAPVPVLLVDLENPHTLLKRRLGNLRQLTLTHATQPPAPATLWHKPGGIDLRKRADRLAFEDVLRRRRPKLVTLGPLYKAYARGNRETDEQVAAEVQTIFDDLRTRYGFALLLEHHAPQASGGVRDLRPFGSSLWLRWPEYGIKLSPNKDRPDALTVGRWRGDRSDAFWPDELHRGGVWPWEGYWRDRMPKAEVESAEEDEVF